MRSRKLLLPSLVPPLAVMALACSSEPDATPSDGLDASAADAAEHDAEQDPEHDAGRDAQAPAVALSFRKITLHRDFYCEGAAIGDLDDDGAVDVIAGPHWYSGPEFTERHDLWNDGQPFDFGPAPVSDIYGYSDCFFQWTRDLNADGLLDVLMVGFPGQAASWLENPDSTGIWGRHTVADTADTESPEYLDLIGDSEPELLFASGGKLSFALPSSDPRMPWEVHAISDDRGFVPFTHGLGAADVNGDGRMDVLEATAWWEQPEELSGDPVWTRHEQQLGSGGAQMLGDDVDGDGDTDIVVTLSAHGYGLAWYEQQANGAFVEHLIVSGAAPAADAEVILHEPHALAMADIDGDGLQDLITGERHWGHVPEGDPHFDTPAHLYWFRLVRDAAGAHYEPTLIDDDSGVGTQISLGDVNADELLDIVIANKKGAFVFVQER